MVKWLCMHRKQTMRHLLKKIQQLPLQITIPSAVLVFAIVIYAVAFLIERPVSFSYAGETCVRQLTLLPGLQQTRAGSDFSVRVKDKLKVGDVTLASFSSCFIPVTAPKEGQAKVSVSPFGGGFAQKTYNVSVKAPIKVNADVLAKPVPISRPLTIEMDESDHVFSYQLTIKDRVAECIPKDARLLCDVQTLDLVQGQTYQGELVRTFQGERVQTVIKRDISVLPATKVTDSSVKPGETVYARPKHFTVAFDKEITKASPKLVRVEGDKRSDISLSTQLQKTSLEVIISEELARGADYELIVDGIVATDGSSLEQPYIVPFKMSGGPKVTGASVGATGVAMGSTAVITFDQPLSEKQDVSKFVALGGGATLSGKRGNQLLISLSGVPKCGDFSIKITNDIQSNYDIAGNSAWSFGGRMVCHTIGTIGYSSRGRAINAYYFGNGSRTVVFTGAIHGSEYSTKSLMDRWIQDLEANARKIPADKQIVVVPAINPDGLAAGSRTNARNVDLNRNFGTGDWRTDVTDVNNRPFPGGGGPSPMSEPETNAIASLVQRLRPIVVLSYHSIGGVVAANQAGGSSGYASAYSQLSGYRNTTGQTGDTFEYGISGTADDWYAERLGVASVLIELGSHSHHQFDRNQKAMWHIVGL